MLIDILLAAPEERTDWRTDWLTTYNKYLTNLGLDPELCWCPASLLRHVGGGRKQLKSYRSDNNNNCQEFLFVCPALWSVVALFLIVLIVNSYLLLRPNHQMTDSRHWVRERTFLQTWQVLKWQIDQIFSAVSKRKIFSPVDPVSQPVPVNVFFL